MCAIAIAERVGRRSAPVKSGQLLGGKTFWWGWRGEEGGSEMGERVEMALAIAMAKCN